MVSSQVRFRRFVLSTCSLVALIPVACFSYWPRGEDFRTRLECRQSIEDVRNLASMNGAANFEVASTNERGAYSHFLQKKDTLFYFWFEEDALKEYQEGRYSGPKELELSVRTNLCSGVTSGSPMLKIVAPDELRDSIVTLNGVELTGSWTDPGWVPSMIVGIPSLSFGIHEIRLKNSGGLSVVKTFEYRPTTYWPEERQLLVRIESEEITEVP